MRCLQLNVYVVIVVTGDVGQDTAFKVRRAKLHLVDLVGKLLWENSPYTEYMF